MLSGFVEDVERVFIRVHAAYCVPASCQVVTFPAGMSERRRVFSEAFLARAEAAIADLDARGALREVAGL